RNNSHQARLFIFWKNDSHLRSRSGCRPFRSFRCHLPLKASPVCCELKRAGGWSPLGIHVGDGFSHIAVEGPCHPGLLLLVFLDGLLNGTCGEKDANAQSEEQMYGTAHRTHWNKKTAQRLSLLAT